MLDIYIDADACPVKGEVYKVAQRYGLTVYLVSNKWMNTPGGKWIKQIVVENDLDAADDWIVEHVGEHDIVITGDIPLAARSLDEGAQVIGHTGRPFTPDNVCEALASRQLLKQLREQGVMMGGPPPFSKKDRSQFLQKLDETIQRIRRENDLD